MAAEETRSVLSFTSDRTDTLLPKLRNRPNMQIPWQVQAQFDTGQPIVIFCLTHRKPHQITYKAELWIQGQGSDAQGSFSMSGNGFFNEEAVGYSENQPMQLNIEINDAQQGQGYSFQLVNGLCEYILELPDVRAGKTGGLSNIGIVKDYLLLIDSDASYGFWEHSGMTDNPYYESSGRKGLAGYEKSITFKDLHATSQKKIEERAQKLASTRSGGI
jgi:hypothetical protein